MKNPTETEINEAHSAIDWSPSACGVEAHKDPTVALLFDEPSTHPDRAEVAKRLCASCPMLGECLLYALKFETPTGQNAKYLQADILMAGFSLPERQLLKRADWYEHHYGSKQL